MGDRAGRVAIVTGAGQGIGLCIARRLVEQGFRVVLADRDAEAGREAEVALAAAGEARFVQTDVADEPAVSRMVAECVRAFGRIDVLVNNAGIFRGGPVETLTLEMWNLVLGTNLTGMFLCAKHAAPHLRHRGGAIVNIASTRALMSEPNTEAYSASKGGVLALTHALAMSLGPAVRVNAISPGWIETAEWKKSSARRVPAHSDADRAQHPAGRVGTPDDIAALVLYLASPQAGFVTGQDFVVDGGMTRKMIYV